MYEQGSFEPVARVVQLSEILEKQRIDNAVTHVWQYVPSGIVTQDVLDNVEKAKQPLVKIYHYHNNHLGTPQELTNQDGDVIWLTYDRAWGGSFETIYKPQFIDNWAISESELQPIKFQGQSLDIETGLHYNRFRYYDSDVGMFISRDPIGLLGGNNVFQYAPNPVGWIDPYGLAKFTVKVKNEIIDENTKFFGKPTCENCGIDLVKPKKSKKGVTPPANEWQTDHIEADIKGGANTKENGQLLCRKCNRDFSDKEKPNLKAQNREDYAKSQSLKKKNPCT